MRGCRRVGRQAALAQRGGTSRLHRFEGKSNRPYRETWFGTYGSVLHSPGEALADLLQRRHRGLAGTLIGQGAATSFEPNAPMIRSAHAEILNPTFWWTAAGSFRELGPRADRGRAAARQRHYPATLGLPGERGRPAGREGVRCRRADRCSGRGHVARRLPRRAPAAPGGHADVAERRRIGFREVAMGGKAQGETSLRPVKGSGALRVSGRARVSMTLACRMQPRP